MFTAIESVKKVLAELPFAIAIVSCMLVNLIPIIFYPIHIEANSIFSLYGKFVNSLENMHLTHVKVTCCYEHLTLVLEKENFIPGCT